jgi:hypothetical protein
MRIDHNLRAPALGLVAVLVLACVSIPADESPAATATLQPTETVAPSPSESSTLAPTLEPTLSPPPTLAPTPSAAEPTQPPTAPPTATASPTAPPTATAPPTPTAAGGRLDLTADPNYGLIELTSGFVPDPTTRQMLSGGTVDTRYIGGGCRGYATAAPDLSVRYTVQGFSSFLRFYFEGNGDTTLIVNDPTGNWLCGDDSYGTLNPTIDINDPDSGRYDIWVGSYTSGATVSGTLSITELDGNHP